MTGFPEGPLRSAVEAAVRNGTAPGVALALGVGARTVGRLSVGAAELRPRARPLGDGTLFDLASLTKVMATAPAVLALRDHGRLSLEDPVGRYLPAFTGPGRDGIRIRHLLTHTGGLRASRRFYLSWTTGAELRAAVAAEPLVGAPGRQVVYSDLGFLLLGEVVEKVTGAPLDEACAALLYEPLGLARTGYRPGDRFPGVPLAATTEPGAEPVPGAPHDRNARLAGGVAGHAGLFSSVDDLARYAAWWSGGEDGPIRPVTRTEAMRCATPGSNARRGHGWATRGDDADFLDGAWSPAAVVHTGFTGTSIAVDPDRGWWVVLLTNAVHLGRDREEVGRFRAEVHRLAAALLTAAGPR